LPDELRLAGSFLLSIVAVTLFVPVAIRLARRTGFLDVPAGYKGHSRATPYLGGLAVVAAVAVTVFVFGVWDSRYAALLIWGLVLFVVGTVDDRRNLNPLTRLVIEVVAAGALWHYGLGWAIFDNDLANIALTVVWVVGLVNAFNLMDNMDGAASTVAGISAVGAAFAAVLGGDIALAVIVVAVAGACLGFLPANLAKPSKIFLGDGGSMPLGFIVAGAVMVAPTSNSLGLAGMMGAALIVGLPILDTTLVVISRRRAGRPLLTGGRDHLTHRLRTILGGSPRLVALALAAVQATLCLLAVGLSHLGPLPVTIAGGLYVMGCGAAIWALEVMPLTRLVWVNPALRADSVTPEKSAA
jgi:UDP-GlcNAc:undecaprenyl-phosphate GlcNAc-1-phosphate transferase